MPINIHGWVEFNIHLNEAEREEEHAWLTWMDISAFMLFNDEVNWILLGNPRDFKNDKPKFTPIAKNRGFPKNPSNYLKSNIDEINDFQEKYGKEELFGFTYFLFSEIEKIDWKAIYQISIGESEWGKLFQLTKVFKELKQIESSQIRFTVWYNW